MATGTGATLTRYTLNMNDFEPLDEKIDKLPLLWLSQCILKMACWLCNVKNKRGNCYRHMAMEERYCLLGMALIDRFDSVRYNLVLLAFGHVLQECILLSVCPVNGTHIEKNNLQKEFNWIWQIQVEAKLLEHVNLCLLHAVQWIIQVELAFALDLSLL